MRSGRSVGSSSTNRRQPSLTVSRRHRSAPGSITAPAPSVGISIPAHASGGLGCAGPEGFSDRAGRARRCSAITAWRTASRRARRSRNRSSSESSCNKPREPGRDLLLARPLHPGLDQQPLHVAQRRAAERPLDLARVTPAQLVEALIARVLEPHPAEVAPIDPDRPLPVERRRAGERLLAIRIKRRRVVGQPGDLDSSAADHPRLDRQQPQMQIRVARHEQEPGARHGLLIGLVRAQRQMRHSPGPAARRADGADSRQRSSGR